MCLIPSLREWKRKLITLLFVYFKQLYDPFFPSKRCYNFKRFQSDFSIFFQNYPLNQHYRDHQFCHFSTAKIPYMTVIRKMVFKRKNNASPINLSNEFLSNWNCEFWQLKTFTVLAWFTTSELAVVLMNTSENLVLETLAQIRPFSASLNTRNDFRFQSSKFSKGKAFYCAKVCYELLDYNTSLTCVFVLILLPYL